MLPANVISWSSLSYGVPPADAVRGVQRTGQYRPNQPAAAEAGAAFDMVSLSSPRGGPMPVMGSRRLETHSFGSGGASSGGVGSDSLEGTPGSGTMRAPAADSPAADGAGGDGGKADLSEDEQKTVDELKARDQEVRQHEAAHQSAGGGYAGPASYSYQRGPDGKNYAVGGEVSIDTSDAATPDATVAKMQIVRAAALAPANPSGQDMAVASAAAQREMQARQEAAELRRAELNGSAAEGTGGVEAGETDEDAATEVSSGNAVAPVFAPVSNLSGRLSAPALSAAAAYGRNDNAGRRIDLVA